MTLINKKNEGDSFPNKGNIDIGNSSNVNIKQSERGDIIEGKGPIHINSHNIWFSVIMIAVLALGGGWVLGLRIKINPQGIQFGGDIQPQTTELRK